jgi:peptidoglycan/xylan/chitin deacetylase (PgdA/CDA1 family)
MPSAAKPATPSLLRQLARRGLAATLPRRWLLVRGSPRSRSVCLTFDDGPHPVHTPRLLEVLKQQQVPATFFVVGREVERYPDVVRRILAEGHALGHHSFSHGDPARTSARELLEEVRATEAVLNRVAGASPSLFRPPHGKLTAGKLWRLWRGGQTVVLWNVDPKDFACPTAEELRAWFRLHPLRGGDVVLLHDTHPHAAEVLPELIAAARVCGLDFTTPRWWVG